MANKIYILASLSLLVASGYMYYKCKRVDKEEPETIMDEIESSTTTIYCELEEEVCHNFSENKELEDDDEEDVCHLCTKFNCSEPLRMSDELLDTIGEGSEEIIYNICEVITLLDAYLDKENLMTHQVVTVNYPLAKLVGFQKNASIGYNLLLNILLEHHVSKY